MKGRFFWLLAAALCLLLTACAGKAAPPAATTAPTEATEASQAPAETTYVPFDWDAVHNDLAESTGCCAMEEDCD